MDRKALERAAGHVAEAQRCMVSMKAATSLDELERGWIGCLTATQRAFSKLDAGAKGKSSAWHGKVKKQRREDPLLQYAHQARHAEEHGVENVTAKADAQTFFRLPVVGKGGKLDRITMFDDGHVHVEVSGNPTSFTPPQFEFVAETVRLLPVVNCGQTYAPPVFHLGIPVEPTPLNVADALVSYLTSKVEEAAKFVVD